MKLKLNITAPKCKNSVLTSPLLPSPAESSRGAHARGSEAAWGPVSPPGPQDHSLIPQLRGC